MNEFIVVSVFLLIFIICAVVTLVFGHLTDNDEPGFGSWIITLFLLTCAIVYCLFEKGLLHWG
jgi:O-antigen/teichoic acid export membrane protein